MRFKLLFSTIFLSEKPVAGVVNYQNKLPYCLKDLHLAYIWPYFKEVSKVEATITTEEVDEATITTEEVDEATITTEEVDKATVMEVFYTTFLNKKISPY